MEPRIISNMMIPPNTIQLRYLSILPTPNVFSSYEAKLPWQRVLWEDAVGDANEASFILSRKFIHANVIIRR